MPTSEQAKDVIITVADDRLNDIGSILERCRAAGLKSGKALSSIGTITGKVEPGRLAALRKVGGVSSVEEGEEYRIAPPDSDLA